VKPLNLTIILCVAVLASITVAGAAYYKPRLDAPYIPRDLTYTPIFGGGITIIDMTTNQTITPKVSTDHIDVYTTYKFFDFKYKAGENVSIPLYFKYISDTRSDTVVKIDPQDPMTLQCMASLGPGKGGIMLNDYFHYSPQGIVTLPRDELVEVTLTICMPGGLWPYPEPRSIPFNLLGVDSGGTVLIVPRFSCEIEL